MEFPGYADITVHKRIKLHFDDSDKEYYQREGFREDEVKNIMEREIRDRIWQYINDNDLKIVID